MIFRLNARMRPKRYVLLAVGVVVSFLLDQAAHANLLTNGDFEAPVVSETSHCGPYADCLGFDLANSDIGGWTVVGKGGVASAIILIGNDYIELNNGNGQTLNFNTVPGDTQAVDLTGEGNQGTTNGIKQTVASDVGAAYALSFFVGHQYDLAPGYSGPASVSLWIDGSEVDTYTNSAVTFDDVTWEEFTYIFSAATDETTIAFLNATDIGNNYAGLDNVDLAAIPEPGALVLFGGALAMFSLFRRMRLSPA